MFRALPVLGRAEPPEEDGLLPADVLVSDVPDVPDVPGVPDVLAADEVSLEPAVETTTDDSDELDPVLVDELDAEPELLELEPQAAVNRQPATTTLRTALLAATARSFSVRPESGCRGAGLRLFILLVWQRCHIWRL